MGYLIAPTGKDQWYIGDEPDTPLAECYIIWEDEIVEAIS